MLLIPFFSFPQNLDTGKTSGIFCHIPFYIIKNDSDATFQFGSAELTDNFKKALIRLEEIVKENSEVTIALSGFMDKDEFKVGDKSLAAKRGESVRSYLISRGIDSKRLSIVSESVLKPFKVNKPDQYFKNGTVLDDDFIKSLSSPEEKQLAHRLNRRVEFKLAEASSR